MFRGVTPFEPFGEAARFGPGKAGSRLLKKPAEKGLVFGSIR